jgi:hypothetical protein
MLIALLRFCLMVSLASPMAEVLSHRMVMVGGSGYPMSFRVVRSPAACWPPVNRAAYSASPADDTTQGIIVDVYPGMYCSVVVLQ